MSVKWYGDKVMKALENANEAGLIAVAIDIEGQAKLLSEPVDTGRLRGSITYATNTSKSAVKSPARTGDGVSVRPKKGEAIVGTAVEYAPHIEYGTRRGIPPRKFLRGAVDARRSISSAIFTRTFIRVMQGVK